MKEKAKEPVMTVEGKDMELNIKTNNQTDTRYREPSLQPIFHVSDHFAHYLWFQTLYHTPLQTHHATFRENLSRADNRTDLEVGLYEHKPIHSE